MYIQDLAGYVISPHSKIGFSLLLLILQFVLSSTLNLLQVVCDYICKKTNCLAFYIWQFDFTRVG